MSIFPTRSRANIGLSHFIVLTHSIVLIHFNFWRERAHINFHQTVCFNTNGVRDHALCTDLFY